MSSRHGCPPSPALRPSEHSDTAEARAASTARKSARSAMSASSMPMLLSAPRAGLPWTSGRTQPCRGPSCPARAGEPDGLP
eukprot:9899462-Alexandrium_andersonii.AAC.1